ncbi:MAG: transketolase [Nanoarchaeota archaeon]
MENEIESLKKNAQELRKKVLNVAFETKEGHLGGSLSEIEILVSLYNKILDKEDKFILSKGHACLPLFILLKERGLNPHFAGHPDIDLENGITCTTGSLGHGLPIAIGMAIARKIKNQKGDFYVLMGDGECQEGTVWESSLIASNFKLDNLIVIVDKNSLQALDKTENILPLGNLAEKFRAFGYDVSEVNGHSFPELLDSLKKRVPSMPRMIIANTVKGKGVSFIENCPKWHACFPTPEELNQAMNELT